LAVQLLGVFCNRGGARRHVEAQVDAPLDRPGIAAFALAPVVEHLTLVRKLIHADVGHVPAVRVTGGDA
jgi:hypothetical protein